MKNILAIIFTIIIVGLMAYTLLNGRAFQGGEAANIIEDMKYIKDPSTQIIANEKPDQKNEDEEKLKLLYSAISELNDIEKALVFLYLEDKDYTEISETLGISEVNARVKMNRVKGKLKKILNP